MLEHFQRDDLNHRASRAMAVLHPLKLVIDNYPGSKENAEFVEVQTTPKTPRPERARCPSRASSTSSRTISARFLRPSITACRPAKKCACATPISSPRKSVVKDAAGNVVEVHCTYDPLSRGGNSPDGRKVKSTMHWVSAAHAISAEIRLYDKLFSKPDPYDLRGRQRRPRQSQPQLAGDL